MQISKEENPEIKAETVFKILHALPDWFAIESAVTEYVRDSKQLPTWFAKEANTPVGFLTLKTHNTYTAEIYVMGVLENYHNQGVGKKLVSDVLLYLKENHFKYLTVKTLSPSREDEFYKKTRMFYESLGFLPIEEFKTLWGEANPCLMMIRNF